MIFRPTFAFSPHVTGAEMLFDLTGIQSPAATFKQFQKVKEII